MVDTGCDLARPARALSDFAINGPAWPPELEALARMVHGPSSGERRLLFLQAFFDESRDAQSARVHGMAGMMAPSEYWWTLWQAWDRVLEKHHLPYMHWADCVAGYGVFKGLDDLTREKIQADCLRVIVETEPKTFAANASIIEMQAYTKFLPRLKVARKIPPGGPINGTLGDEYFLGFQHTVQQMAMHPGVPDLPAEEQIAFIFDQTEFAPRAYSLFMTLKSMPRIPYSGRLGDCGFADMKRAKPLQMADALAYEYVRFADDLLHNRRAQRWQHKLLHERFGTGWILQEEHIEEFVVALEEVDQAGATDASSSPSSASSEGRTSEPR